MTVLAQHHGLYSGEWNAGEIDHIVCRAAVAVWIDTVARCVFVRAFICLCDFLLCVGASSSLLLSTVVAVVVITVVGVCSPSSPSGGVNAFKRVWICFRYGIVIVIVSSLAVGGAAVVIVCVIVAVVEQWRCLLLQSVE